MYCVGNGHKLVQLFDQVPCKVRGGSRNSGLEMRKNY